MKLRALTPTLFAAASLLAACGGDAEPTVSVTASPTTFASGGQTTLTVSVTDFDLREPETAHGHDHSELVVADGDGHDHDHEDGDHSGETLSADGGHYHVYLDSTDTNPLLMHWDAEVPLTVTATPGAHRLIVRLNADDHRFLKPEVKAHVDITIE